MTQRSRSQVPHIQRRSTSMIYFQSICWAIALTVGCLATSTIALADDQRELASPENLREKLEVLEELIETDRHECPYLTMRISPPLLEDGQKPGWVLVIFDVSVMGKAIREEIVDASVNEEYRRKALELIRTFRFVPRSVNGRSLEFNNWVERVDFLSDGAVPDPTWPNTNDYFNVECPS